MAKRSLRASEEGIRRAKRAFSLKGWTQEYLSAQVGLHTRQPIWRFFTGRPVDRHVFIEICFNLDLDPEDIATEPAAEETTKEIAVDVDALVARARSQHAEKIQNQCGTLRLLDIARPVELDDLYVDVNILEETSNQIWLDMSDIENLGHREFERIGQKRERQPALQALEDYTKLFVLGKPGAGKTTFLQFIAVQCNLGHFKPNQVPIFIRLKDFAEEARDTEKFDFLNYVYQEFGDYGISQPDVETILSQGRGLILLDGLDEVQEADHEETIKQLRKFSSKFFKNQIVITCRIAASQYRFQGFTEVEIADFSQPQIEKFVQKWFAALARNASPTEEDRAAQFIEKLNLPENQPIRELVSIPLLLSLTCLGFQAKGDFPTKRSELYKQGLQLLLSRWDEARGIKRDDIYRNLSLSEKIELLAQVASIMFTKGNYFFEASKVQQLIEDCLSNVDQRKTPSLGSNQQLDGNAVLKSIEAQHGILIERARGIYSFSHLTFQEYLTAKKIVSTANSASLEQLVEHVAERRWQEVFLLVAEMLPNTGDFLQLMKQRVDAIAAADEQLQQLLTWIDQKTSMADCSYHQTAIRAFYFTLTLPPDLPIASDLALAMAADSQLVADPSSELGLDLALNYALAVVRTVNATLFFNRYDSLLLALDFNHFPQLEPALKVSLQTLTEQLPDRSEDREALEAWWQTHGQSWTEQLTQIVLDHRTLGHQWQFTPPQKERLKQYYDANQLLLACLDKSSQLEAETRDRLKETILRPIAKG